MAETQPQTPNPGGNADTGTYEPGIGRLAAALAAVQLELPRIRKAETGKVEGQNKEGKWFSYSYSYADLAAVSAAVLPLLGKHGLAFTAFPTTLDGKLVLRYHLLHTSGEMVTGEYPLPLGGTAQQLGSAITYARRYCLCAVTGVAPDDDDDAAAADGAKDAAQSRQAAEATAKQAAADAAYAEEFGHAADAVRGAWANQYGAWDGTAAEEMYRSWSKGGTVAGATPGQLRNFAAMIHAQPQADAGSTPDPDQTPADQTTQPDTSGKPLTGRQRGQIFASMNDLGLVGAPAQREYLGRVLERPIKSRSELMAADADALIKALDADLAEGRRTGLIPMTGSGAAPTAQSAAAGDRVPAAPEPPNGTV